MIDQRTIQALARHGFNETELREMKPATVEKLAAMCGCSGAAEELPMPGDGHRADNPTVEEAGAHAAAFDAYPSAVAAWEVSKIRSGKREAEFWTNIDDPDHREQVIGSARPGGPVVELPMPTV